MKDEMTDFMSDIENQSRWAGSRGVEDDDAKLAAPRERIDLVSVPKMLNKHNAIAFSNPTNVLDRARPKFPVLTAFLGSQLDFIVSLCLDARHVVIRESNLRRQRFQHQSD